ncbi:MAG: 2-hydroxyacyl-CoA dehydratase [Actinobacteria bacterium]|nr:MAG: 2-hydroxyacyl-CoA dehydratase [Actinomycetota bacterium]
MREDNNVAWFCTYTPLEILDAAGLTPERRFGDPASLESADIFLHPAICPYVRACLAVAIAENGPHHAVFVNSCDGMRRLYDAWRDRFRDDFVYLVDLPRNTGSGSEELLACEYRNLVRELAGAWGREVTAHDLVEAAREREERRLAYVSAAEGVYGEARLRLAMASHTLPLHATLPAAAGGGGERGVPVLLTGNLLNPAGLVRSLDRAGARVAWIDLCNGDRAFSSSTLPRGDDLDGILASLAHSYLDRHPCARMSEADRRQDLLVESVEAVGAKGVIYASLKFCDSYLYDFPRIQKRLQREGIPLLRLESDYADGHVGQLLTRVEAFLEML